MAIATGQGMHLRLLLERGVWREIQSVCELGSQEPRAGELREAFAAFGKQPIAGDFGAKKFYEYLGAGEYTCIDFNGEHDSLVFDLNRNLRREYKFNRTFDLVTNFGTSEHCFNQFEVFRNIHELCAAGGIMLHTNPGQGWGRHCFYRYDANFFDDLAAANNYEVIYLEPFLRLKPYFRKDKSETIAKVRAVLDFTEKMIDGGKAFEESSGELMGKEVVEAIGVIGKGEALFSITMACAMRKRHGDREFVTPIQGMYQQFKA